MDGWLPENWGDERVQARAGEAVAYVRRRARRERNIRLTTLAVAACLAGALGLWVTHRGPSSTPAQVASRPGAGPTVPAPPLSLPLSLPQTPSRQEQAPVDVTLQKAGSGVDLTWPGDSSREYVVYRCTSPKFDTCATGGIVKGNRWSDPDTGHAVLVFYKVEPVSESGS